MKIAVRYYTRSNNTKKLAEAIAHAVGEQAQPVATPLEEKVDVLFLGCSPYAFDVDDAVKRFIDQNHERIGKLVHFGTSAAPGGCYNTVRKLAQGVEVPVAEEHFHCPGSFLMMHRGRPNGEDCDRAAQFARDVIK